LARGTQGRVPTPAVPSCLEADGLDGGADLLAMSIQE